MHGRAAAARTAARLRGRHTGRRSSHRRRPDSAEPCAGGESIYELVRGHGRLGRPSAGLYATATRRRLRLKPFAPLERRAGVAELELVVVDSSHSCYGEVTPNGY